MKTSTIKTILDHLDNGKGKMLIVLPSKSYARGFYWQLRNELPDWQFSKNTLDRGESSIMVVNNDVSLYQIKGYSFAKVFIVAEAVLKSKIVEELLPHMIYENRY